MDQSTQMFQRLVGNVKVHYWGTAELQAQNHFLKDLYTGVSGTEVLWFHVKPSSSCRVLRMNTSVLLTCALCQSPHTLCVKCDRENRNSVVSLKRHSWVHLVLQQQHFTPALSISGFSVAASLLRNCLLIVSVEWNWNTDTKVWNIWFYLWRETYLFGFDQML